MKVVVQHPITHFYLTPSNDWKPRLQDARLFHSACEAVTHSFRHIQPPYNVVLKFDDPQYDFSLLASDDLNKAAAPTSTSKPNGTSGERTRSIAQMLEQCREMSRSSKIMINDTKNLIAASRKVVAGSKKSIASVRRDNRRAQNGTR